jgi:hypothetical protein
MLAPDQPTAQRLEAASGMAEQPATEPAKPKRKRTRRRKRKDTPENTEKSMPPKTQNSDIIEQEIILR